MRVSLRLTIPAVILSTIATGSAVSKEKCELEALRFHEVFPGVAGIEGRRVVAIEGATTCRAEMMRIRIYSPNGDQFASARALIRGYAFTVHIMAASPEQSELLGAPSELKLRYSIDDQPWLDLR